VGGALVFVGGYFLPTKNYLKNIFNQYEYEMDGYFSTEINFYL